MNDRFRVYHPAALTRARYRILYGGAGSGKSVYEVQDELARLSADGRQRLLVVRKVARTCRGSTFQLFRDVIEALGRTAEVDIREQDMRIRLANGAEIIHAGLDDPEKLKSIAGITRIWVEEATELTFNEKRREHDFDQLDLRLRGVPVELVPQITLTFNPSPAAAWIVERFGLVPGVFPPARGHAEREATDDAPGVFVQHTTYLDNPRAGADYARVFAALPESMQAIYRDGTFSQADSPDQVIPWEAFKRACETPREDAVSEGGGRRRLGVDVARFGGDTSTAVEFEGFAADLLTVYPAEGTTALGLTLATRIRRDGLDPSLVGIDGVGLGAGTVDRLREEGLSVTEIVSGASPVVVPGWTDADMLGGKTAFRFRNLRAQMWWFAREMMRAGRVHISPALAADVRLKEDLLAPRYRIGSERMIEVEPKDGTGGAKNPWSVRSRLGRSPDRGDAFVYGLFVEHVRPIPKAGAALVGTRDAPTGAGWFASVR